MVLQLRPWGPWPLFSSGLATALLCNLLCLAEQGLLPCNLNDTAEAHEGGLLRPAGLVQQQPRGAGAYVVDCVCQEPLSLSRRRQLGHLEDGLSGGEAATEAGSLPRLSMDRWPAFMFGATTRQPWLLPFTARSIRVSASLGARAVVPGERQPGG